MLDLDELESKAKAATPGPWDSLYGLIRVALGSVSVPVAEIKTPYRKGVGLVKGEMEYLANAEFIAAANPKAILELIRELRDARAAVAAEREECAKVCEAQADLFEQSHPWEGNRPYA